MESSALLDRLERLEKRNQVLTSVLVVGVAMIAALLSVAACSPDAPASEQVSQDSAGKLTADTLEVKELILKDGFGGTAARLWWDTDQGTNLTLFTEEGDEAVHLVARSMSSRLTLSAKGDTRIDLEAEYQLGISNIRLFDHEQRVVVHAGHEGGASSVFLMGAPDSKVLRPQLGMVMRLGTGAPNIRLRDPEGNVQYWGLDQ